MKQSYFLSKTDVARDQEHLQYITFRNDHLWPCPETLAQWDSRQPRPSPRWLRHTLSSERPSGHSCHGRASPSFLPRMAWVLLSMILESGAERGHISSDMSQVTSPSLLPSPRMYQGCALNCDTMNCGQLLWPSRSLLFFFAFALSNLQSERLLWSSQGAAFPGVKRTLKSPKFVVSWQRKTWSSGKNRQIKLVFESIRFKQ